MLYKLHNIFLLVLIICLSIGCFYEEARGAQSDFITSTKTTNSPIIDGKADDQCWSNVDFVDSFTELNSHKPSKLKTKFKCVYDNHAVYFLFVCEEKKEDLVINAKKHDDAVWYDSCIELLISPDKQPVAMTLQPNGMHFGHFMFNAAGVRFEKIGENPADEWNPEWKVKTTIKDGEWIAEVALPFKMISMHNWRPYYPRDLTVWKVQIARSPYIGESVSRNTIFKGIGKYANMSRFGSLVFTKAASKEDIAKQLDWNQNIKPVLLRAKTLAEVMQKSGLKKESNQILAKINRIEAYFNSVASKRYKSARSEIVKSSNGVEARARQLHYELVAALNSSDSDIVLSPHPAMKDSQKVLPDFIPSTNQISKPIKIQLCPGEYEPASFVIWANKELKNVSINNSDFKAGQMSIPADSIDLYWVKCWYQGADSGPTHTGNRVLTPELLLKNSELVQVDLKNKRNIFRHKKNEGDKIDNPHLVENYPDDAVNLQPIKALPKHFTQQVWLTAKVSDDTPAGTYKGYITVTADNSKASQIPVQIKVLDFKLKPNPLISGVYLFIGGWEDPSREAAVLARMKNLVQHGVTNPSVRCDYPERFPKIIERMRKAGLDTEKAFILTYRYWVDKYANSIHPKAAEELTSLWLKYAKKAGVKQIYLYLADEAQGKRLKVQEKYAPKMREMGAKTWVACYRGYFPVAGEWIDAPVIAGPPVSKFLVDKIHAKGNIILNYANPQCGSELPETYRRNYGLLLWAADYDGSMNYNYWGGFGDPWDDFDHPFYRDHNMAYPTKSGMIDTIQWEGWREGVDDCRYLATLLDSIKKAKQLGRTMQAKSAETWVRNLKKNRSLLQNLDKVRNEMIYHIEQCRGMR